MGNEKVSLHALERRALWHCLAHELQGRLAAMEWWQTIGVWFVVLGLMVGGLVGCVVPFLPGHLLILAGVVGYKLLLGDQARLGWWGVVAIVAFAVASQVFETLSGAAGAHYFGGTKWGSLGAFFGMLLGLLFMPLGLLLGPLLGAFVFEWCFGKREFQPAAASGVGSLVGVLAGLAVRVLVGLAMVVWFAVDVAMG